MKQNILKIVVLSLIVGNIVGNIINKNWTAENTLLIQSVNSIFRHSLVSRDRLLLFYAYLNNTSLKSRLALHDFINGVFHHIDHLTIKIFYQHKKLFYDLKHNELLLFDDLKAFRYFFENIYKVGNKNLSNTLMVMSSITSLDIELISIIFKELYEMGVLNVALIVQLSDDDIVLLTYFPFTPTSCQNNYPVIINHYLPDQQRWTNSEYFPKKLKNLYGCPLICCTWDNMPYFAIKHDPKNQSIINYFGIEADILKFAAKRLNFSIQLHIIGNDQRKSLYKDGVILAKLFAETCNFSLGGFAYKKDLNESSPFSQTNSFFLSHVYVVTNVLSVHTTYEKIAYPFNAIVWYTIGLVFAISSLLIYTCERRRKWKRYRNFIIGSANTTPHFYLFASSVGATMTEAHVPKRTFARFLLICWLLTTLILRCAYQSGMYQMLRENQQWKPPKTIANLFEQNYLISMTPENRRYLPILPEIKRMLIFNSTILQTFPELLKVKEPIAFITTYEHFGYFGKVNASEWQQLHRVNERLLTQQLTFYVRHHSYLIHELNDQIADSQYYGFSTQWDRQYVLNPTNTQFDNNEADATNNNNNNLDSNMNVLSMLELGGIFMILLWLHLFASVCFVIEVIWYRYGDLLKTLYKKPAKQ